MSVNGAFVFKGDLHVRWGPVDQIPFIEVVRWPVTGESSLDLSAMLSTILTDALVGACASWLKDPMRPVIFEATLALGRSLRKEEVR